VVAEQAQPLVVVLAIAILMITHHQAGIHMAQYAVDHANVIEVRRFAYAMVTAHTGEISEMRALVAG
jgi:uncharacterized protein (DUF305 family)